MKEPGPFGDSLPGGGVSLTLGELQDMAARQQQQLEVQHQLLSAREQRLHFLKHGSNQGLGQGGHGPADGERLRRLRERVEAQEQKLRKLRALRGQVDSNKLSNAALTSDLDSIRALFNEKEKELSLAVAKVEELTHQLEELRRGRQNALTGQLPASIELDKLRRELMYRNKLNEQQNLQISHQRETLCQKQEEVNEIDRRISELQERLHRKRLLNQQLANQITVASNKVTNASINQNFRSSLSNASQHQQQKYQDHQKALLKGFSKQPHHRQMDHFPIIPNNTNCVDTSTDSEKSLRNYSPQLHQGPVPVNAYLIASAQNQKVPSSTSDDVTSQIQNSLHQESQQSDLRYGSSQDDFHMKLQQQKQPVRFAAHNVNNLNCINNNNLSTTINNNVSQKNNADQTTTYSDEKDDFLLEFSGNKSDPKYQTLPYKFSPNCVQNSSASLTPSPVTSSSKSQKLDSNSNMEETNKRNVTPGSAHGGMHTQSSGSKLTGVEHLSQHSNSFNKLASSSLVQGNLHPRVYGVPPMTQSGAILPRGQPVGSVSTTSSTSVSNTPSSTTTTVLPSGSTTLSNNQGVLKDLKGDISPPQSSSTPLGTPDTLLDRGTIGKPALPPKPAVPIKPTPPPRQIQHLAPYFEGSAGWSTDSRAPNHSLGMGNHTNESIRPASEISSDLIENNVAKAFASISLRGSTQQNQQPQTHSDYSNNYQQNLQNSMYTQDALQEKIQETDDSSTTIPPPPPPPLPTTEPPPEEVTSFTWRTSNENPSVKSNASVKKQSADGSQFLNSINNGNNLNSNAPNSNNNTMHMVSLNRRIEMPPAFLFPENETPPADLIATRDDNRSLPGTTHESSSNQDEVDRIMPLGGSECNTQDENRKQSHSPDNINKCGPNVNDIIETMNTINTSGPQSDDTQPVIGESKGDTSPVHILRKTNKKGNLKSGKMSVSSSGSRRVSFDPLALLLDASLEGELELVRKTAGQVSNPSAANDEGITALHNAICAGHLDIVKFLVEFGCDVNAQDSDGWTPLHCAASCNNLAMVRFLVEHGACIFATTLSDHETAAEKCEEDEEGFDGCSEYLYSVQEKLGILNNGVVYAVFDYDAHNADELSFHEGDKMIVLRKGDEWEREWWWSRLSDQEGYIPRNLLGLYPRVQPKKNPESNLELL